MSDRHDYRRDLQKHDWRPGDRPPLDQRCAVAQLVGYCEGIIKAGTLSPDGELALRERVEATLTAFNMPSKIDSEQVPA